MKVTHFLTWWNKLCQQHWHITSRHMATIISQKKTRLPPPPPPPPKLFFILQVSCPHPAPTPSFYLSSPTTPCQHDNTSTCPFNQPPVSGFPPPGPLPSRGMGQRLISRASLAERSLPQGRRPSLQRRGAEAGEESAGPAKCIKCSITLTGRWPIVGQLPLFPPTSCWL